MLLDPSKSGRSLWVKKWISFFSMGVTEEEEKEEKEKSESFVVRGSPLLTNEYE